MAGLKTTNLRITSAQIPPDFSGTVQDLQRAFVERLEILSTTGSTAFVVGDVEPSSDQGPWLKNGDRWYVFDANVGHYVPINIDDSLVRLFVVSEATPSDPLPGEAQIWVRTKGNRVLGWYFWTGSEWRPEGQTPPSGPTVDRPTDPADLEQFFDTDINVMLHFERGAWRTLSGSPGDVKPVTTPTLAAALTQNPGWIYLGEFDQTFRGRALGVASTDPGATPAIAYPTDGGISARAQGAVAGSETVQLADSEIPQHTHRTGAAAALGAGHTVSLYRVDNADTLIAPGTITSNGEKDTNAAWTSIAAAVPGGGAGAQLITSKQLSGALAPGYTDPATAHSNMSPTKYLWWLTKE